ncbi:Lrp/AsnC ligand binding domain-containing protein [Microbacterium aurum]
MRTHPDVAQYFYVAGAEDFVIHFRGRDSADLRSFVTDHLSTHSIVAATNTSLIFERTDGLRGV